MSLKSMSLRLRGSSLIAVLLIIAMILIGGLALMSSKSLEYDRVAEEVAAAQALCLAQAGVEDAVAKLRLDGSFPPVQGHEQNLLTYSEDMYAPDGTVMGSYRVTLDTRLRRPASSVILIESEGTVGGPMQPQARHTLRAEFNLNPVDPATCYQLVNYQDLGAE